VRTASLNAPSFKNFPHLMFSFKNPKSIIISMLSIMHVRLSSAYCSNLTLMYSERGSGLIGLQLPSLRFCDFPQSPHHANHSSSIYCTNQSILCPV
jgi:hypothetical protein